LIQDAITYLLSKGYSIEIANFNWKFNCLFLNFLRRQKGIKFDSMEDIEKEEEETAV
jgi:hypothetical protein